MHLKRATSGLHLPLPRKGTKYLARAQSNVTNGIPVVIAIRDILGLAQTSKEVKQMVNQGLLKINGKPVTDIRQGIRLMNILEADQSYMLRVLPTGRYSLDATKKDTRVCKIVGKKALPKKKMQLNLHDGSNVVTTHKARVGDSVELDMNGKLKKVLPMEAKAKALVVGGSKVGQKGTIKEVADGTVHITLEGGDAALLARDIVALG